ncbi:UDP-2,4-diacetamido-2,4,6-trideoxy-beta-L-altropyranose hydrolase [Sulfurimonas sp. RIFCSPLOWO2_12_36_12]|uniref:UDP-2,4-diacetamido-2,4, 6-trideoxy-beta-L-altropyranose hydrolase n=1 Tax=Sulfurimonas sp. RIFCSPLOWO2_12_36_12 TaxID=1802253 RepID=UPI000A5D0FB1|nr:UDP-2,4-diacetamido-2,4,6-trideoxy-beta-L-altropyranose hydrolase [Sulfurimonas sp. RIFCSPLOWO2_12_36_12]
MTKVILFRADSSSTIGTGHIMRDLVLAKQYPKVPEQSDKCPWGAKIIFAVQDLDGNINQKITEANYQLHILKNSGIDELSSLIKEKNIDTIVIDHYGIDAEYEKKLKTKYPSLKIFVLDDTYEKHHCDILLNHNIYANAKRYKNLVPKSCELRCGSEYTLLRDEFIEEKSKKSSKKIESADNIFLAMGGADTQNLNPKILEVLSEFDNIKVAVVTTTANRNLKELKNYVKNKKWIKLHINSEQVAKLMRKSDFAIITPSVTANEVYFMEKPFIAIKTAENQKYMYKFLKKKKFLVLNKFKEKKLKKHLEVLLGQYDKNVR